MNVNSNGKVVTYIFSEDTKVTFTTETTFSQHFVSLKPFSLYYWKVMVCISRHLSVDDSTSPETRKRKCEKNDVALSGQLHLFTSDFIFIYW